MFKGFFIMRKIITLSMMLGLIFIPVTQVAAETCYDLWYKRNAIFDANGYCFSSRLGRRIFDNSDCWTKNPRFSRKERMQIRQIRRQERRKGCKVN